MNLNHRMSESCASSHASSAPSQKPPRSGRRDWFSDLFGFSDDGMAYEEARSRFSVSGDMGTGNRFVLDGDHVVPEATAEAGPPKKRPVPTDTS